jgi:hypothetical protein
MSPHGRLKGPRCSKHAAALREAGIGAQAQMPVHTHPLGGTAHSVEGTA